MKRRTVFAAMSRGAAAGAAAMVLVAVAATTAQAHDQLLSSMPAAGAVLEQAPGELRLRFSMSPSLALTSVELIGTAGSVALGDLRHAADSSSIVIAPILRTLLPDRYVVRWRIVGRDGHPVRGEYAFSIVGDVPDAGAGGVAGAVDAGGPGSDSVAPLVASDLEPRTPAASDHRPDTAAFDVLSPGYTAVRWLTLTFALLIVGTVAFRTVVLGRARLRELDEVRDDASRRAARIGAWSSAALVITAFARLALQSEVVGGPGHWLSADRLGAMSGTVWGLGWSIQIIAALAGSMLFARAARGDSGRAWWGASAAAFAVAVSLSLSGHAAGAGRLAPLMISVDLLHVIAAAGWLGTLALLLTAGLPAAIRHANPGGSAAVAALVAAFSPAALLFAGLAATTGALAAWINLGSLSAVTGSAYGRTLLIKLGVLSLAALTGAYNWRRVAPALAGPDGTRRLRRSATVEVVLALLVLAVTAVLVATPPPSARP